MYVLHITNERNRMNTYMYLEILNGTEINERSAVDERKTFGIIVQHE
jgi:hypothetical protein